MCSVCNSDLIQSDDESSSEYNDFPLTKFQLEAAQKAFTDGKEKYYQQHPENRPEPIDWSSLFENSNKTENKKA